MTPEQLRELADDTKAMEIVRAAVERALVEFRDSRISLFRNNGLVIREANGAGSDVIRLGMEDATAIGLRALADAIEQGVAP